MELCRRATSRSLDVTTVPFLSLNGDRICVNACGQGAAWAAATAALVTLPEWLLMQAWPARHSLGQALCPGFTRLLFCLQSASVSYGK